MPLPFVPAFLTKPRLLRGWFLDNQFSTDCTWNGILGFDVVFPPRLFSKSLHVMSGAKQFTSLRLSAYFAFFLLFRRKLVKFSVLGLAFQKLKVFNSVVGSDAVNMVNNFPRGKRPFNRVLHHDAVNKPLFPFPDFGHHPSRLVSTFRNPSTSVGLHVIHNSLFHCMKQLKSEGVLFL